MAPRERVVHVDALREAARAYAEATSQRQAARDIGLSGTGFRAFLAGGDPHPGTVRKLTEWYVRQQNERGGDVPPQAADAALALLVAHLPAHERNDAVRRLRETVRAITNAQGAGIPTWLRSGSADS